jgi:hypothetical protein
MNIKNILLAIIFWLLATSQISRAQLIPILGDQRAGTAMAQFLKIGVGGRAVGMGESFVAVANDASALYWNPGGIAQMQGHELFFSHVNWPVDVQHEFFGYVHRLSAVNFIGVSVTALHTDDLEETTEFQPHGTGNFVSFGDIAIGLTFARKMTDRFGFGVTVKYIEETLAELHARNALVDLGTYYRTGFGNSRFAVAVCNFGTNIQPIGTMTFRDGTQTSSFQEFAPPIIFRIGFATEIVDNEQNKITTAVQLNHPNDNAENLNLGMEYWWKRVLALRGGYRVNVAEESFTFGGGVAVPLPFFQFNLDFSYTDFGRLGNASRVSANLKF